MPANTRPAPPRPLEPITISDAPSWAATLWIALRRGHLGDRMRPHPRQLAHAGRRALDGRLGVLAEVLPVAGVRGPAGNVVVGIGADEHELRVGAAREQRCQRDGIPGAI